MRRTIYLETFGCQMNVLDSELVMGQLRALGYEQTEDRDEADVVLFNTCSVREHAEQKVWSRLGQLRQVRKHRPGMVIGVIGCMAEREGTSIFSRYPHVDVLCGPAELDKLPAMIGNAVLNAALMRCGPVGSGLPEQSAAKCSGKPEPTPIALPRRQIALMGSNSRRSGTLAAAEDHLELLDLSRSISPADGVTQAYVRITRGCNKFCSYCVVPYTRGPEVHRPPGNIIDEVKRLADAGVKEVTLLGQTVNHYLYKDSGGGQTTFADLLYKVHESAPSIPRLRFVTSFPRDFTDEALQAMRDCPRICHYLHVPAQSGSDRILKLMNRGYTVGQYRDLIGRARAMMSDLCIASDFIVGFPTETEEEHQASLELIRQCAFKNSFIFKYSPRPGTAAIKRLEDDVPEDVKRRRNNEMLAVQAQVSAELNQAMVGKRVEIMVEGESKLMNRPAAGGVDLGWERGTARTQLVGRTRGDQVIVFDGESGMAGRIMEVTITRAQGVTLFARAV